MNLATMQERFRSRTSGLADSLSTSDINVYLNTAYQHNIPKDIGGEMFEGIWSQELERGVDSYDYPEHIVGVIGQSASIVARRTDALVDPTVIDIGYTHWVDLETDIDVWQFSDREVPTDTVTGAIPTSALYYGRKVYVSPAPDEHYFLRVKARLGPSVPLGNGTGETDGLGDDTHALLVVCAAAAEYLDEQEDDLGAQRARANYAEYKALFITQSETRPRQRRPRRSF